MIPLRDMRCLPRFAGQQRRDRVRLLGPWAAAKAEGAGEQAAIELRIGRAFGGGWKFRSCDRGHAWVAAGDRRLRGDDAAGKSMPGGHARSGKVIGAKDRLARSEPLVG